MPSPLVRAGLGLLVLLGVAASVLRASFPADLGARLEPYRARVLDGLGRADPDPALRASEVARFDSAFARHRTPSLLHVVPGGLFLLLAPLQLAPRLRTRRPRLHRWTGRVLVAVGLVSVANGFYFGLLMPYAGPPEAAAIALFGGLFAFALVRGLAAIRRGDQPRHREWMIRAFALAVGISTVRVVGAFVDLALSPAGVTPATVFVVSLWLGWLLTVGVVEAWPGPPDPRLVQASVLAGTT